MPDKKISDLTAMTTSALTDESEEIQGGVSKRATLQQRLDAIGLLAAPAAGLLADADEIAVAQSNVAKAARLDRLRSYIGQSLTNHSVAAQGAGFATDTYVTGSSITVPSGELVRVRTLYHCVFDILKSTAGTATPILIWRFGTAGSVADAARLTFTFAAQTAVADLGTFEVWVVFRTIGATGVAQGRAQLRHGLVSTGLSVETMTTRQVTSGTFDMTVANSIMGLSFNGGGSFSGTIQMVNTDTKNL